MNFELNYLAIILAAIVSMIVGMLWYSAFSEPWMKLVGKTKKQIEKEGSSVSYILSFVASLVLATFLSILMQSMGVSGIMQSATVGGMVWLGFVAPTMIVHYLYEGTPLKLYALNAGYHLVQIVSMAIAIGLL